MKTTKYTAMLSFVIEDLVNPEKKIKVRIKYDPRIMTKYEIYDIIEEHISTNKDKVVLISHQERNEITVDSICGISPTTRGGLRVDE